MRILKCFTNIASASQTVDNFFPNAIAVHFGLADKQAGGSPPGLKEGCEWKQGCGMTLRCSVVSRLCQLLRSMRGRSAWWVTMATAFIILNFLPFTFYFFLPNSSSPSFLLPFLSSFFSSLYSFLSPSLTFPLCFRKCQHQETPKLFAEALLPHKVFPSLLDWFFLF